MPNPYRHIGGGGPLETNPFTTAMSRAAQTGGGSGNPLEALFDTIGLGSVFGGDEGAPAPAPTAGIEVTPAGAPALPNPVTAQQIPTRGWLDFFTDRRQQVADAYNAFTADLRRGMDAGKSMAESMMDAISRNPLIVLQMTTSSEDLLNLAKTAMAAAPSAAYLPDINETTLRVRAKGGITGNPTIDALDPAVAGQVATELARAGTTTLGPQSMAVDLETGQIIAENLNVPPGSSVNVNVAQKEGMEELAKLSARTLNDMTEVAARGTTALPQIETMVTALSGARTGALGEARAAVASFARMTGVDQVPVIGDMLKSVLALPNAASAEVFRAAVNQFLTEYVKGRKGDLNERELVAFQIALPGLGLTPQANAAIIWLLRKQIRVAQEKARMAAQFYFANNHLLITPETTFENEWAKYYEANLANDTVELETLLGVPKGTLARITMGEIPAESVKLGIPADKAVSVPAPAPAPDTFEGQASKYPEGTTFTSEMGTFRVGGDGKWHKVP